MALLLLPVAAHAQRRGSIQRQAPADIERVEVTQLTNAVRVTLHASGIINLDLNSFWNTAWKPNDDGDWNPVSLRRVPIRLWNCRSKIGAFHNVATYPVSHVEIGADPADPIGIGIDVAFVLYRPATNMSYMFWDGGRDFGWWVDGLGYDMAISRDKRSLIFTIMSDRFPEKPVERVQPGPERPERLSVERRDGRFVVNARYVPIRTFLDQIAAQGGESIVVEDGLDRTISLHLDGMGLQEVLESVAVAYGLSLSRLNGEWAVGEGMVTRAASYVPTQTRRFPLKYLAPADAVDLLPNFLLTYVHADREGNALVASGPESLLNKVAADLARLDVAPPQIEVKALAVESTSLRALESAFEFDANSRRVAGEVLPTTGSLSYRRVDLTTAEVEARVRALAQRGMLKVRAEPRTTVLNGRAATLFVGRHQFIKVARPEWRGLEPELRAIPVGVSLSVTPWSGGGEVALDVCPEVTTIDEVDRDTGLPVIGVRRAKANVRVAEGDSVLISGLRLVQEEAAERRVPVLGDLPVFEGLFRSRQRQTTATELAVFVSARVVK